METVTVPGYLNRRTVLFYLAFLSALLLLLDRLPATKAQLPCPDPVYNSEHLWAPWTSVHYSFDGTGALGVATNATPAFTLNGDMQTAFGNGMEAWNAHAGQNGTQVTYTNTTTTGNATHIVTVAWPAANVTWTDSAGNTHTSTVTVSQENQGATAVTVLIPDINSSNQSMPNAGVAITLINTNATYPVNNTSYPSLDPTGGNFLSALTQLGAHETGHTLGLADRPSGECGNVMSLPLASSQNPSGGTNNNGGDLPPFSSPVIM